MKTASLRFYEELNDFLPKERRKKLFDYQFTDHSTVREIIEKLGVPHSQVDLIIVNGISVNFDYQLQDRDYVSVYPVFESLDITPIIHLRPEPLRKVKFILDVHLGRLAKYLRICGFDSYYENLNDDEIIETALQQQRIILTKDKGLLKNKKVTHGYWIRSTDPKEQLLEVFSRFDLKNKIQFLVRCLLCNNKLQNIDAEDISQLVPQSAHRYYDTFLLCPNCNKVYWKGSHYNNMEKLIEFVTKSL